MSFQAVAWVLDHSESRLGARLVLISIAHRVSNDDGEAWPSHATIAKEAGIDERNVRRQIQELVSIGEIEISVGGAGAGSTNTYRLPRFMEWLERANQVQKIRGAQGGDLNRKGGDLNTIRGALAPTEPSLEPSLEPSVQASQPETFKIFRNKFNQVLGVWPSKNKTYVAKFAILYRELGGEELLRRLDGWLASTKDEYKRRDKREYAAGNFLDEARDFEPPAPAVEEKSRFPKL